MHTSGSRAGLGDTKSEWRDMLTFANISHSWPRAMAFSLTSGVSPMQSMTESRIAAGMVQR